MRQKRYMAYFLTYCASKATLLIYLFSGVHIYTCTDEAQKAETVLSAVSYIYIYIYL